LRGAQQRGAADFDKDHTIETCVRWRNSRRRGPDAGVLAHHSDRSGFETWPLKNIAAGSFNTLIATFGRCGDDSEN